jgi:signal transduction histidine kinase
VICRTAPLRDNGGRAKGVLHMSVRAGQGEDLQQAMTAFDSQVGAVSHGIKGLLTAMAGGFYLWDTGLKNNRPERLNKGFHVVRRSFHRLQRLAHDVLYYVRDRRLHMEPLDGIEMIKELKHDLKDDAEYARTRIVLHEDLPSELPMEGDLRALRSALSNLVISSLHDCYTDKRKIDHLVTISAREEGDHALIEVTDNGPGMGPETRGKIFSLFFNPKGIEAAGVGLYISNKLVRAHKGTMKIESEKGKGSRYIMKVPLHRWHEATPKGTE